MYEMIRPQPWQLFVERPYLDEPISFAQGSDPKGLLRRISYVRLSPFFPEHPRINLARRPKNAHADGVVTVLLENHFPTTDPAEYLPRAIAISSLEDRYITSGQQDIHVAEIVQIQTATYDSERDLLRDMGGLDFKALFVHFWEQYVINLNKAGAELGAVAITIEDSAWDVSTVRKRERLTKAEEKLGLTGEELDEYLKQKLHRIRRELAARMGYHPVPDREDIWLKPVGEIVEDKSLQGFLSAHVKLNE